MNAATADQRQNSPFFATGTAQAGLRLFVPAALGGAFAVLLCAATSATTKVSLVIIAGVACLAVVPMLSYFRGAVEDVTLFALAATLSISLKYHPIFRLDHFGGAIGIQISVTDLLMIVLVAAVLFRKRHQNLFLRADTAILLSFVAYWFLAALSAIAGYDRQLGIFELVATLQAFALFILLVSYLTNRKRLVIYFAGFLTALVLQSGVTVLQSREPNINILHFLGAPEQESVESVNGDVALPGTDLGTTFVEGEVEQRPAGLLIHPNVLAFYLVLAIPAAIGIFLAARSRWLIGFSLFALISAAVALYATLSRSGWAGTIFGGGLAVLLGAGSLRTIASQKKLVMTVLLLAGLVGLITKADKIYSRIVDTADEAIEFRENLANIALNMVQAHPILGVGLNSFIEATDAYDPSGSQRLKKFPVHNVYLLEASEVGVPGGLAFLAMVLTIIIQTIRTARRTAESWRLLPLFIAVGIAGFWFTQLSDFAYRVPILTTILWSHVAMVFAAAHVATSEVAL